MQFAIECYAQVWFTDMRQDMKELKMFKDLTVDNVIDKGRIEFHSKIVFAVTCSKCCKVCIT